MCDMYECTNDDKAGVVEVKHAGCTIGTICKRCLDNIEGVQLLLKREKNGFILHHVDLLDRVL